MEKHSRTFRDAALLIVAHGSKGSAAGRTTTLRMAETIAAMDMFAAVHAAFLTESPLAIDVLDAITQREVYIVPHLAVDGFIAHEKLPCTLKLTGRVTQRISKKSSQRILLTDPVGTHPLVTHILAERIKKTLREAVCKMDETALVIIGHGSRKERQSFTQTAHAAAAMAELGVLCPTTAAYLEEAPFVKDWKNFQGGFTERHHLSTFENVIFAPLLITDGFHAARDIPLAIGLDPTEDGFQNRLAAGEVNEKTMRNAQRILYLAPVGNAPEMADVIVARAKQAASQ